MAKFQMLVETKSRKAGSSVIVNVWFVCSVIATMHQKQALDFEGHAISQESQQIPNDSCYGK